MSERPTRTPRPIRRGLRFSPGGHRYTLDGRPVPGVTTILGCLDKPALPKWAASTVATYVAEHADAVEHLRALGPKSMVNALKEIPWKKRDDQGTRGNLLHDHAEALLNGDEIEVDDEDVPVMEHALDFMDDWHIEPLVVEQPIGHRGDWWAGTPDLIARYRRPDNGHTGVGIFDWKSGKMIYPELVMQVNAYGHGEFYGVDGDEHPVPECDAGFGVHIRPDGVDVYEARFGRDIYDEFREIRRVYDVVKRMRGDWRTPGSGYLSAAIQQQEQTA